jgi:hypothetical protein
MMKGHRLSNTVCSRKRLLKTLSQAVHATDATRITAGHNGNAATISAVDKNSNSDGIFPCRPNLEITAPSDASKSAVPASGSTIIVIIIKTQSI